MASTFNKFYQTIEDIFHKVHDCETDTFKVALTNTAPVATNTILANITEISYTNLSGNPTSREITTVSSGQTTGNYSLVWQDLTLTASGGALPTFQYVVVYNDTAASDPLIGWINYGSAINIPDGEDFVIDFSATAITAS